MSKEVDIILLEKYLAGQLDSDQVLYTDGTPLSETELSQAVDEYNELVLHIEGAALKESLKAVHQEVTSKVTQRSIKRWLPIAASVLLIGVFITLIWQKQNQSPSFDQYFDHFDQLMVFRDSDSTDYSSGIEAYSKRDYVTAYELLTHLNDPTTELQFYTGVSALGSNRLNEAIALFKTIGTTSSNKYYQQTRWYLGLAYWQIGEADLAAATLSEISKGQYKYEEAQRLIKQLPID